MPTVYRITYPNGKIYVGQDLTDTLTYFGSASGKLVASDFTEEERRSFKVTKDVLCYDPLADKHLTLRIERKFILKLRLNDPEFGYNRWPKYKSADVIP